MLVLYIYGLVALLDSRIKLLAISISTYQTAQQQIGELLAASENYGLAVSRCLSGLSRPMKTTDLNDRDFKNAVHEDIICLLEKNLEVYHDI